MERETIQSTGQCAAYELDDLSLAQPGVEQLRSCARRTIQYTYEGDIECDNACDANLQLSTDGIIELQTGACLKSVVPKLAEVII